MQAVKTVDEYIASFPKDIKSRLEQLRQTVRKAAPQAEEIISYQMPAFRLRWMLIYFAAHKSHIGFYFASRTVLKEFKKEISFYKVSKGTIQFPLEKPLPLGLIAKIVKYRVKENLAKEKMRKQC